MLCAMTIDASTNPPPPADGGHNSDRDVAAIGIRLLDDAYAAWAVAESECECALRAWQESHSQAMRYPAYRAALDREEAAARDLERLTEIAASYSAPAA
jgi:hypothetical protein